MAIASPEIKFLKGRQPRGEDYLWRYVNLKKFLSFLIDQKLHLKRLDQFEDKNDGIFANLLQLKYNLNKLKKSGKQVKIDEEEAKLRELQRNLFASCWFVGNNESMAMWKIFSNPDSVALRIKYKDLKEIFKKRSFSCQGYTITSITLGKVQYCDYKNGKGRPSLLETDSFVAFSKDESFSNEKEFRIVVRTENAEEEHNAGIDFILHDFKKLPFEIVYHPKAEDWGVKNLKDIMETLGLKFKNLNSELNLRYWISME
jgi:hypothetical protein